MENDADQFYTWAFQIDPEIRGKPDSGPSELILFIFYDWEKSELKIQIKWDGKNMGNYHILTNPV